MQGSVASKVISTLLDVLKLDLTILKALLQVLRYEVHGSFKHSTHVGTCLEEVATKASSWLLVAWEGSGGMPTA